MPKRDTLYERSLKHPLDDAQRAAIVREATERCRQLPLATESGWDETGTVFTVKSALATFYATFSPQQLVVSAELSLAARLLATEHNRKHAVALMASVADELDL